MMLPDDINLFYSNGNINQLLEDVNKELGKITDWCFANKMSINKSKTKNIQTNRNNIP